MFYFENIDNKQVLKSDLIKNINTFFTTKDTIIQSKNTELNDTIIENKNLIKNYLKIDKLISPIQTHSDNIVIVDSKFDEYPDTDALILTQSSIGIFLNFADCTPIILYDEKQNIGAIAHAGWRGTAQNIVSKTVQKMIDEFKTNPQDVKALIGPAISICCYNVGEEVLEKLSQTVTDFSGLSKKIEDKIFVDLKNINKRQLEDIGVKQIDVCPYCTVCNNDKFFSYRKENATTNRHSAVLALSN